jgi:hemoglobin-like flavoprotein
MRAPARAGSKEEIMTINLSERTRAIVADTLPLMTEQRAPLQRELERHMLRQGLDDAPSAGATAMVAELVDMLLDHAGELAGNALDSATTETARRHRALRLGSEHYSCFGDALKPIMQDVLGKKAPTQVISAWGDTYWAIVRMLFRQEARLAA